MADRLWLSKRVCKTINYRIALYEGLFEWTDHDYIICYRKFKWQIQYGGLRRYINRSTSKLACGFSNMADHESLYSYYLQNWYLSFFEVVDHDYLVGSRKIKMAAPIWRSKRVYKAIYFKFGICFFSK